MISDQEGKGKAGEDEIDDDEIFAKAQAKKKEKDEKLFPEKRAIFIALTSGHPRIRPKLIIVAMVKAKIQLSTQKQLMRPERNEADG